MSADTIFIMKGLISFLIMYFSFLVEHMVARKGCRTILLWSVRSFLDLFGITVTSYPVRYNGWFYFA